MMETTKPTCPDVTYDGCLLGRDLDQLRIGYALGRRSVGAASGLRSNLDLNRRHGKDKSKIMNVT